jgi:hypothetical protein
VRKLKLPVNLEQMSELVLVLLLPLLSELALALVLL